MRLFFAAEVISPWPENLPQGRVILEQNRHLTLAFLGESTMPDLNSFPKPPFSIGLAGFFDQVVFLPPREPHVAAWRVHWLEDDLLPFQKQVAEWLRLKEKGFFSHVTIARNPFVIHEWKEAFQPLPMYAKNIRLCESLGDSQYRVLFDYPILAPFTEIEHTADIAFVIRGNLYFHAQLALAFHFPPMIPYFDTSSKHKLDEIISALNTLIARVDSEIGCPFKAVSFHGTLSSNDEWEMIVDV